MGWAGEGDDARGEFRSRSSRHVALARVVLFGGSRADGETSPPRSESLVRVVLLVDVVVLLRSVFALELFQEATHLGVVVPGCEEIAGATRGAKVAIEARVRGEASNHLEVSALARQVEGGHVVGVAEVTRARGGAVEDVEHDVEVAPGARVMQRGLTFGVDRVQVRVGRRARRREVAGRARVVKTLEGVVGVHRADPHARPRV